MVTHKCEWVGGRVVCGDNAAHRVLYRIRRVVTSGAEWYHTGRTNSNPPYTGGSRRSYPWSIFKLSDHQPDAFGPDPGQKSAVLTISLSLESGRRTTHVYQINFLILHCFNIFICGNPSGSVCDPLPTFTTHCQQTSKLLQSSHQRPRNWPAS